MTASRRTSPGKAPVVVNTLLDHMSTGRRQLLFVATAFAVHFALCALGYCFLHTDKRTTLPIALPMQQIMEVALVSSIPTGPAATPAVESTRAPIPQKPIVKKTVTKKPAVKRQVVKKTTPKPVKKVATTVAQKPVAQPINTVAKPTAATTATQAASAITSPSTKQSANGGGPSTARKGTSKKATATTAPIFNAAYLRNPPPVYPKRAKQRRLQGEVMLKVTVNKAGNAANVTIANSSGAKMLDNAALNAVKRWRFVPAKRGEEAVVASVLVPIEFRL